MKTFVVIITGIIVIGFLSPGYPKENRGDELMSLIRHVFFGFCWYGIIDMTRAFFQGLRKGYKQTREE